MPNKVGSFGICMGSGTFGCWTKFAALVSSLSASCVGGRKWWVGGVRSFSHGPYLAWGRSGEFSMRFVICRDRRSLRLDRYRRATVGEVAYVMPFVLITRRRTAIIRARQRSQVFFLGSAGRVGRISPSLRVKAFSGISAQCYLHATRVRGINAPNGLPYRFANVVLFAHAR